MHSFMQVFLVVVLSCSALGQGLVDPLVGDNDLLLTGQPQLNTEEPLPPLETEAPAPPPLETEAPPLETEAPAQLQTGQPPLETEAPPLPPLQTEAPPLETEAPPSPPLETEAPPLETEAPQQETEAPPPLETEPPQVEPVLKVGELNVGANAKSLKQQVDLVRWHVNLLKSVYQAERKKRDELYKQVRELRNKQFALERFAVYVNHTALYRKIVQALVAKRLVKEQQRVEQLQVRRREVGKELSKANQELRSVRKENQALICRPSVVTFLRGHRYGSRYGHRHGRLSASRLGEHCALPQQISSSARRLRECKRVARGHPVFQYGYGSRDPSSR